jgi:outer membrane protein assembly factor BamB
MFRFARAPQRGPSRFFGSEKLQVKTKVGRTNRAAPMAVDRVRGAASMRCAALAVFVVGVATGPRGFASAQEVGTARAGSASSSGLTVTPKAVRFNPIAVHASSGPGTVMVRNNSTRSISISISLAGQSPRAFSMPKAKDSCNGRLLPSGSSCQVTVRLRPTSLRKYSAHLTISGGSSPLTVPLTGRGVVSWSEFDAGATHAGASAGPGPTTSNVSWTFDLGDGFNTQASSPIIGPDGTIYLESGAQSASGGPGCGAQIDAISPSTHQILWSWSDMTEDVFSSTPALGPDGTVYVVADAPNCSGDQGDLIAIASGGTTLWKLTGLDLIGSPTVGPDGTVYVEDSGSTLYAVNPSNGQVLWSFAGSSGSVGEGGFPAISPDGTTLYLPSGGGDLYALTAGPTGGQLLWTYQIQGPQDGWIVNAPAVGADGTIYVATGGFGDDGSVPGDIEAVNPDGTLKWSYLSNATFQSTPTVTATGQIIAGNEAGTVVALNQADGSLAWSYQAPGPGGANNFVQSAAAASDGTTYIQNQFSVFAFSATGALEWSADESVYGLGATPALDGLGTLYVTAGPELLAFSS